MMSTGGGGGGGGDGLVGVVVVALSARAPETGVVVVRVPLGR